MRFEKPVVLTAEEELIIGMRMAFDQYEYDKSGKRVPLSKREWALLVYLVHIAEGNIALKEVRQKALQGVRQWQEDWQSGV